MTAILKTSDAVSRYLAGVSAAIDANKNALGFLPKSAIDAHGAKGQLWVAVNEAGDLQGFIMFGGGRSNLPVFAVHVLSGFEGRGIATNLVSDLKEHAAQQGFQTLSAKVADDLPANQFWDACGFILFRQVPGGVTTKRTINVRVFEVPNQSLMPGAVKSKFEECFSSESRTERDDCVIDINVLLDQVRDRKESEYARRLLRLGLNGQVHIRVAPEFTGELERSSRGSDDPLLSLARELPALHRIDERNVNQYVEKSRKKLFPHRRMTEELSPNEVSDLVHIAYCAYYKIEVFVTRDGAILRAGDWIQEQFGVRVMTPFDLVESIDSFGGAEEIRTQNDSVLYRVRPFCSEDVIGVSEATTQVSEFFTEYSRVPAFRRYILEGGGQIDGVAFIRSSSSLVVEVELACAFISRAPVQQHLLLLLGLIRDSIKRSRLARVNVCSLQDHLEVWSSLADLGFKQVDGQDSRPDIRRMSKFTYQGVILWNQWKAFVRDFETMAGVKLEQRTPAFREFCNTGIQWVQKEHARSGHATLRAVEECFEPLVIALPDRPAAIVPIRPEYAVHLLGMSDATDDMFGSLPISLSQHRVYFRSARNSERLEAGGLIFFYVSGRVGSVTSLARVVSSEVRDVEFAKEYFQRRGVLSDEQLTEMSSTEGDIHCIRFNSVHNLPAPLSLDWLKEMKIADESNMVTIRQLSSSELQRVLEKGFTE